MVHSSRATTGRSRRLRSSCQTRWWAQGQVLRSFQHVWEGPGPAHRWSLPLWSTSFSTSYLRWYGKCLTSSFKFKSSIGPRLARLPRYLAQRQEELPRLGQRRRSSSSHFYAEGWWHEGRLLPILRRSQEVRIQPPGGWLWNYVERAPRIRSHLPIQPW